MTGIVLFVSYNVFVKHIRGMSQVFQYIYCREVTRARLRHIIQNKIFQRMIFRCTLLIDLRIAQAVWQTEQNLQGTFPPGADPHRLPQFF